MQNCIRKETLFTIFSEVLSPLGLFLVEIKKREHLATISVNISITNEHHTVGIDECAKAHRIIRPRLELMYEQRDIDLEVSTPGIQRNFEDVYEFSLFTGKRCRIYHSGEKVWLEGIIRQSEEEGVWLSQVSDEHRKEVLEEMYIPYSHIHKAKLAYAWEDVPRCPVN